MAYTEYIARYHAQNGSDYDLVVELHVGSGAPSVAQFDAAISAFFDELENQKPGHVQYVYRDVEAHETTSGIWTAPT